jgi:hypothetical protein
MYSYCIVALPGLSHLQPGLNGITDLASLHLRAFCCTDH